MTNFVQGFEEENFWDKLRATELMIFPKGKPLPAPPSPTIAGITGALGSFADNPFFMDVVEQVKSMDNLPDITEMSDFMNAPQFHKIVNNIKEYYGEKSEKMRKDWGGNIMGQKSQNATRKRDKAVEREAAKKAMAQF
jgi:hypothetical protein